VLDSPALTIGAHACCTSSTRSLAEVGQIDASEIAAAICSVARETVLALA
jgi:hypothetical protein